jgi:hypothetical protein
VEALAHVRIDCVEGRASVSFMLPLPREKAVAFWRGVAASVVRGERVLLLGAEDGEGQSIGMVQRVICEARRRGIGQRLVAAIARNARR